MLLTVTWITFDIDAFYPRYLSMRPEIKKYSCLSISFPVPLRSTSSNSPSQTHSSAVSAVGTPHFIISPGFPATVTYVSDFQARVSKSCKSRQVTLISLPLPLPSKNGKGQTQHTPTEHPTKSASHPKRISYPPLASGTHTHTSGPQEES